MKKIIKIALALVLAISPLLLPTTASAAISLDELGTTIVNAGNFWEEWWNLEGRFADEHIGEAAEAEHLLASGFSQFLPTSGFESMNDIRAYLLQYYTENGLAEVEAEWFPFAEYEGNLYVATARAGFPRPDWTTAEHALIEQNGNRAIVETTVLVGSWHREPEANAYAVETVYRYTLIDGRIDQVEQIIVEEIETTPPTEAETTPPTAAPEVDFVRIIDIFECESLAGIIVDMLSGVDSIYTGIDITFLHNFQELNSPTPITSLAGIENLVNLRTLGLHNTPYGTITDLTPLTALTQLEWLSFEGGNVSDITPLAGLTNLEHLNLRSNNITNIAPLSNLVNLEVLGLGRNNITDLAPLSNLENLTWLEISGNCISDFTPIDALVAGGLELVGRDEQDSSCVTVATTPSTTAPTTTPSTAPTTAPTDATKPSQNLPQTGTIVGISAAAVGTGLATLGGLAAYGKAKKKR